jgi:hypothetical protein
VRWSGVAGEMEIFRRLQKLFSALCLRFLEITEMTKAQIAVLIIFVIVAVTPTPAQNRSTNKGRGALDGWIEAPSSKANPALWECAGYGGSWIVGLQQRAVRANELNFDETTDETANELPLPSYLKLSKEMIGKRSLLRTADGWLIGFDAGEFGGGLWWFNNDGTIVRKLLPLNVHSILVTPGATFVLAGLAHLSLDNGEIDQFIETEDQVTLKYLANLGGSPETSTVDPDGQIVVATMRSVLRVDYAGKVHKLYNSGEDLTYPTSVVVDRNGDIFVAMRFFLLRLVPESSEYKPQWLMPKKCQSFKIVKRICTCTGPE